MAMRKLITGFQGRVSEDGEFLDFEFTSEDEEQFEFRASTDGIDTMMSSLESLAAGAVRRRMDLGTDRGFAPKELPALRSFADGLL
jgi:hypothetical protein